MADETNYQHSGQIFKAVITNEQAHILRRWIGITRYLWNLMLSQRENHLRIATLLEIHYAQEKIRPELAECSNDKEREAVREKMWEQFPLAEKRKMNRNTQSAELTELRNAVDWIGELPNTPTRMVMNDLDKAFQKWFAYLEKKNKGEKTIEVGYPQYKSKFEDNSVSFCRDYNQDGLSFRKLKQKWGAVLVSRELPNYMDNIQFTNGMNSKQKIGWIKIRLDDRQWLDETMTRLTLTDTPHGWEMSVGWKWEMESDIPTQPEIMRITGVDLGAKIPLATWDGETGELIREPYTLKDVEKKVKKAQQQKDRCQRGGNNWKKFVGVFRKWWQKKRRITKYFGEEQSTKLAVNNDVVVFENLNLPAMTTSAKGTKEKPGKGVAQKRALNRVLLRVGLGYLRRRTKQKLKALGKIYIEVSAAWTSLTCSQSGCGWCDPENRTTQSLFECQKCGHRENADINAAKNIRAKGIKELEKMGLI